MASEDSTTDQTPDEGTAAPTKRTPRKRASRPRKAAAPSISAPETAEEAAQADFLAVVEQVMDEVAAAKSSRTSYDLASDDEIVDPLARDEQDEEDEEAAAPVVATVPSFGLLFQAPEPVSRPRRQQPEPAEDLDETDEFDEQAEDESADGEETESGTDTETDAGTGRRRRRRGGKGRGRGREDDSAGADEDGSAEEAEEAADATEATAEQSGEDEAGRTTTRRRRRRRGGSASETEDAPGVVTKVRESRRDEVTGVKGSTRLEAKKQRRREGREAGRRRTVITEAEFLARRESVERTMVVRSVADRTQIGVLEDGVLVEHYVSRESNNTMAGNVYLGRVQNVLPSMEAAFVDIGKGRNAVLYAGEVNWDAAGLANGQAKRIENALKSGESVLVQVTKDPIGHKGARLTSQVSLPGRYLVYVPEGSMTGISRKLPDTERARLKSILKEVVPDKSGVIVRTAAEGAAEEELRRDVERLTKTWESIQSKAAAKKDRKASAGGAPALLYAEPDMTVRVIRDVFNEDFAGLVVQGDQAWNEISGYLTDVAPDLADRASKWTGTEDIFSHYRIDEQLAKAMDRKVWLPSGGSLVIDRTEAMTVVDVNTGKFVGAGGNLEETVTKNNLEAAEEIVRQLRLRDIGGIIVIDFIDMVLESNRDLVVRRLLECLGRDRTKHQVAEVTSLGLVQMTRKRVGSGLIEVFSEPCEHCNGRGIIVQSTPVDRSGGSQGQGHTHTHDHGQASGNGGGRSSTRSRRGKAATETVELPVEEPQHNGPTPAQIAAAAHAAAMKATSGEHLEDDVAELAIAEEAHDASVGMSVGAEPTATTTLPEPEAESTPEPEPTPQPAPEPAPRGRRKRGRVVAKAGAPGAVEVQHVQTATDTLAVGDSPTGEPSA